MKPRAASALAAVALLAGGSAAAEPDFGRRHRAAGLDFVLDGDDASLAYLLPPPFELAGDAPRGASLLIAKHTGSSPHGDSGETFVRSLLRFRVARPRHAEDALEAARAELEARLGRTTMRFATLPIARIETELAIVELDDEGERAMQDGVLEAGAIFEEREFVSPLSAATAEALASARASGGVAASLSYRSWARGLPAEPTDRAATRVSGLALARADALAAPLVDVRRIDLSFGAPADYPSLWVYCFDFADGLRDDLFLKEVEFDAAGVAGGRARHRVSFSLDAPETTVRSVRFPFAVDVAAPYRFRVLEIALDGSAAVSAWRERENWAAIVDVTTEPNSGVAPAGGGDEAEDET